MLSSMVSPGLRDRHSRKPHNLHLLFFPKSLQALQVNTAPGTIGILMFRLQHTPKWLSKWTTLHSVTKQGGWAERKGGGGEWGQGVGARYKVTEYQKAGVREPLLVTMQLSSLTDHTNFQNSIINKNLININDKTSSWNFCLSKEKWFLISTA